MKKILFFILVLIFSTAHALAPEWQIVPNESSITFSGVQNGAPVSGSFKNFTGKIYFDQNQLSASKVHIVINTNSITTSYNIFTDALKTADWFDVKKFPQAIFEATNFTKKDQDTYQANGTLSIKDKTLPIALNFNHKPLANNKDQVNGSVTINRLDYGIGQGEWSDTSVIKNEVQVKFMITAVINQS